MCSYRTDVGIRIMDTLQHKGLSNQNTERYKFGMNDNVS